MGINNDYNKLLKQYHIIYYISYVVIVIAIIFDIIRLNLFYIIPKLMTLAMMVLSRAILLKSYLKTLDKDRLKDYVIKELYEEKENIDRKINEMDLWESDEILEGMKRGIILSIKIIEKYIK